MNDTIIPLRIYNPLVNVPTSATRLIDVLKNQNLDFYNINKHEITNANSFRFYVHSGKIGYLFDGNIPTLSNSLIVEEGLHNIEHVDINDLWIVGDVGTIISLQIGNV